MSEKKNEEVPIYKLTVIFQEIYAYKKVTFFQEHVNYTFTASCINKIELYNTNDKAISEAVK